MSQTNTSISCLKKFLISLSIVLIPSLASAEAPSFDEPAAMLFGQPIERHDSANYQHDFPPEASGASKDKVTAQKTPGYAPFTNSGGGEAAIQSSIGTWIQSGHSGAWYNHHEDGHGLFVEVLADDTTPSGMKVLATWYAFLDGQQVWILAIGPVVQEENRHVAQMDAWIFSGGDFPPFFDPATVLQEVWGTMRLHFNGCIAAELEWTTSYPGFTSGQLDLERLTAILESTCNPDLGGDSMGDDHGDSLQTATALSTDDGVSGNIDSEDDIDVFSFSVSAASSTIKVFTTGSTDTTGELFRVQDDTETSLQSDNNDGADSNFLIEQNVDSGQFSVHVGASSGVGAYTIWLEISAREEMIQIEFDNLLLRNIRVYINGILVGTVPASTLAGQAFGVKLGDRFSWEIEQDFGDQMEGQYQRININDLNSSEITYVVDNIVGNGRFFIPSLGNSTGTNKLLGVNMDLSAENRCNCVIQSGASDVLVGYFRLFNDSNCRFYEEQSGYSGDFLSWDNFSDSVEQNTGLVSFIIE